MRKCRRGTRVWVALVFALATFLPNAGRSTTPVDLMLVLALDVSHSVDEREYDLQRKGLAWAFRHPAVLKKILSGRYGRIAVTAVQWAEMHEQSISVPWTIVNSASSAALFADRLSDMPRRFAGGQTYIAGAIQFANQLTQSAPFAASRRVVDVSGDGINTMGNSPQGARDHAVRSGMTINGLAIVNETTNLAHYYRISVIGGPGAFVMVANDYDDYARAILAKLLREIEAPRIM